MVQWTVRNCTELWCVGRTGHLLQLHQRVCLKGQWYTVPRAVTLQCCVHFSGLDSVQNIRWCLSSSVQYVNLCVSECQTNSKYLDRKIFMLVKLPKHLQYKQLLTHFPYKQRTLTRLTLWQQQQNAQTNGPFTQYLGRPSSLYAR